MNSKVYPIRSSHLKPYIEYILFNQRTSSMPDEVVTSFPHTNICLGIIKDKYLTSEETPLSYKAKTGIHSYISGMYTTPHQINISGSLDEICIDFTPLGFERFFYMPPQVYLFGEDILTINFGAHSTYLFEHIFSTDDLSQRGALIESFLLSQLRDKDSNQYADFIEHASSFDGDLKVENLSRSMSMSPRTLHRKFKSIIGISPKKYLQIKRFRNIINNPSTRKDTPWELIAYDSGYFDYSHMNRDFNKLTNSSPIVFFDHLKDIDGQVLVQEKILY